MPVLLAFGTDNFGGLRVTFSTWASIKDYRFDFGFGFGRSRRTGGLEECLCVTSSIGGSDIQNGAEVFVSVQTIRFIRLRRGIM